jgi:hypothetical protein
MSASVSLANGKVVESRPFALSHRDHFKFGYDGIWFVPRRRPSDAWTVAYGKCERAPLDWRSECIETARLIRQSTADELWVLSSGGIDSEVVLQAFLFADIRVKVAITRFNNDLNRHDIAWAIRFCERHEIPYRCLDLDIERFFASGEAWDYAALTKCVQPQLLHTMWAMDQVDGFPVLGSGECYLVRRPVAAAVPAAPPVWDMFEKERIAAWYRLLMERDKPGCAGFFQYNPENMLAFLRDPSIVALCENRLPQHSSTMLLKEEIYRRYFLLERRKKYHGFENVMHLDGEFRPKLEQAFGGHNGIVRISYRDLVGILAP